MKSMVDKDVFYINLQKLIDWSSVEAEPVRHGHWEIDHMNMLILETECYSCSICNGMSHDKYYKYCPHCGAMMDEKEINHDKN